MSLGLFLTEKQLQQLEDVPCLRQVSLMEDSFWVSGTIQVTQPGIAVSHPSTTHLSFLVANDIL
jgi:hypothetical protein